MISSQHGCGSDPNCPVCKLWQLNKLATQWQKHADRYRRDHPGVEWWTQAANTLAGCAGDVMAVLWQERCRSDNIDPNGKVIPSVDATIPSGSVTSGGLGAGSHPLSMVPSKKQAIGATLSADPETGALQQGVVMMQMLDTGEQRERVLSYLRRRFIDEETE